MTDKDVINYFSKWTCIPWDRIDNIYKEYLINRFKDINIYSNNNTYKEAYFRLKNNIEEIPKCPICGKKCKSRIYSFGLSCGNLECSSKIQSKTYLENIHNKYGENINAYTQLEHVKEKSRNTCLRKYGTTSPLGNKEIWEQTRKHTIEKYGAAYNKEKLNETLMKKYGVPWFTLSNKLKEKTNTKETQEKQYKTKKKNHSFNISKIENKSYIFLKNKYPDVINQYKSDLYPFNCDFYIPSLDLYIECNYHWTHGGHPYNENNKDDIETLNKWKEKDTKFYTNAITTWTIRDVNKRNIVKENNLNYIEFWNINELKEWLNNYGKN
jgi:hypothetical protein